MQNAKATSILMEAVSEDMHLKIVVNVYLAISQRMENVVIIIIIINVLILVTTLIYSRMIC